MRPPHTAAITGMGCVSPLGCDAVATHRALREGRAGLREVTLFSTEKFRSHMAGHVPDDFEDRAASISEKAADWPRAGKLLLVAIEEGLRGRGDFAPDVIIAGTTSGGMDFGEKFYRGLSAGMREAAARTFARHYVPHQPVRDALGVFGIDSPMRVVSNACASGTNALGLAARMVQHGHARRAIAIGFDALTELVFAGFDALQASTPEQCRPFDVERSGLVLGEGAAVFLIERLDEAKAPLATVGGYGCANDNFHLTKPDPSGIGPRRSMERALAASGWDVASIDYLNAHGTGTPFNDASEAAAIQTVCPAVPLSSTKAMTGHALGAAGAIEAAFCVTAMQGGFLPPSLNVRNPMPGLNIVANVAQPADVRRVLSNSFGFGGSNASVLLEKWPR